MTAEKIGTYRHRTRIERRGRRVRAKDDRALRENRDTYSGGRIRKSCFLRRVILRVTGELHHI